MVFDGTEDTFVMALDASISDVVSIVSDPPLPCEDADVSLQDCCAATRMRGCGPLPPATPPRRAPSVERPSSPAESRRSMSLRDLGPDDEEETRWPPTEPPVRTPGPTG